MCTGIDLVRAQLHVASGERLELTGRAPPNGHAIEIRLNAEDPAHDFMPAPGVVSRFRPALGPGVRIDSYVEDGTAVSSFYDSLIAKLVVSDKDRPAAIARAERALEETVIEGMPTTREFALGVLRSDEFREAASTPPGGSSSWRSSRERRPSRAGPARCGAFVALLSRRLAPGHGRTVGPLSRQFTSLCGCRAAFVTVSDTGFGAGFDAGTWPGWPRLERT